MARTTIPGLTKHFNLPFSSIPITIFITVIAILSIFSFVSFLCGSKKGKKLESMEGGEEDATSPTKEKKLISKLNSNISEKALSLVKMISWRKVDAEEQGDDDEDQVLWKKTILMGEKCRPLDFSGKIVYDSQGNMIPELSHHQNGHQDGNCQETFLLSK